jgi:hypothetical protein
VSRHHPTGIPPNFEGEAFLIVEVVAVLEDVADAERQRTPLLVPVKGVEVVADETMQLISVITVPPVSGWTGFFGDCRVIGVILVEE